MTAVTAPPSVGLDLAPVVRRAREAQRRWASLAPGTRARRLRALRAMLVNRLDDIVAVVREETGKPAFEGLTNEVALVGNLLRHYERRAPRLLRARRVSSGILLTKRCIKLYEPYGVVGVISPWNFPFMLPALPTVSALFAGNAVIVKPSEVTPQSGRLLAALVTEALPDHPDLVQAVEGDGSVGAALIHSGVDRLVFIGGVSTGRKVLREAADALVPVVLELGANDVAIVCDDADLERAAAGIVWGAMDNAGQCCIGVEHALVHVAVHDRFVDAARRELARLAIGTGDGAEIGRLTYEPQRRVLDRLVADAVAHGATVERCAIPRDDPGADRIYPPTLLLGVTGAMEVSRAEAFGPLLSVRSVRDDEEAIRVTNGGAYGLNPSVWTRDRSRGRRIAERLEAGSVTINDHLINFGLSALPYGGVKQSGFGRLLGDEGLLEFARVKSLAVTRFALRREPYWFPYTERRRRMLTRLARVWYAPGIREKLRALRGS